MVGMAVSSFAASTNTDILWVNPVTRAQGNAYVVLTNPTNQFGGTTGTFPVIIMNGQQINSASTNAWWAGIGSGGVYAVQIALLSNRTDGLNYTNELMLTNGVDGGNSGTGAVSEAGHNMTITFPQISTNANLIAADIMPTNSAPVTANQRDYNVALDVKLGTMATSIANNSSTGAANTLAISLVTGRTNIWNGHRESFAVIGTTNGMCVTFFPKTNAILRRVSSFMRSGPSTTAYEVVYYANWSNQTAAVCASQLQCSAVGLDTTTFYTNALGANSRLSVSVTNVTTWNQTNQWSGFIDVDYP